MCTETQKKPGVSIGIEHRERDDETNEQYVVVQMMMIMMICSDDNGDDGDVDDDLMPKDEIHDKKNEKEK